MKAFSPFKSAESLLPILPRVSLFGGVTDEQRKEIIPLLQAAVFTKGEYISKKGDPVSHIYIIKSGRVGLEIADNDASILKREFNVGDCFGEAAFLAMNNSTASFIALDDSEIIAISKQALNSLRHNNPELFSLMLLNMARQLARKLQFTDEMLLDHEHPCENG